MSEKEKNRSRQLIMPLELLFPFALEGSARLHSAPPRTPVPCQSVTSVTPYVAKYLCACVRAREEWRRGINSSTVSQSFCCLLLSPSFPTSHLRLASLYSAQVSQSSAEGQTDFTVVGKRVMCLNGAGGLHS